MAKLMKIFSRKSIDKEAPPGLEQLIYPVLDLIEAETWPDKKLVVEQHPELLTKDAQVLLEWMTEMARESHNSDAARCYRFYRGLLARCRDHGVDWAFSQYSSHYPD